jgi:hypothetical protein
VLKIQSRAQEAKHNFKCDASKSDGSKDFFWSSCFWSNCLLVHLLFGPVVFGRPVVVELSFRRVVVHSKKCGKNGPYFCQSPLQSTSQGNGPIDLPKTELTIV